MAKLDKYLTPNTIYIVGIVTQIKYKLVFCAKGSGWKKTHDGIYLIPFDVVTTRVKRGEKILDGAKRTISEELSGNAELFNFRENSVGILSDTAILSEIITEENPPPAYIGIHRKAISTESSVDAFTNNFIYAAKSDSDNFKIGNMQTLFAFPPTLLRKIMLGGLTIGEAKEEGLEIPASKIEIPDDSIIVPQKNLQEFVNFMKHTAKQ